MSNQRNTIINILKVLGLTEGRGKWKNVAYSHQPDFYCFVWASGDFKVIKTRRRQSFSVLIDVKQYERKEEIESALCDLIKAKKIVSIELV